MAVSHCVKGARVTLPATSVEEPGSVETNGYEGRGSSVFGMSNHIVIEFF